ncbi:MAG: hypothetical protein BWY66_02071 [bacterium ADurb.Bin374]|nr:MAG: hypothetical protein BWY66_02071 [bacterium ADurb.Bin374]
MARPRLSVENARDSPDPAISPGGRAPLTPTMVSSFETMPAGLMSVTVWVSVRLVPNARPWLATAVAGSIEIVSAGNVRLVSIGRTTIQRENTVVSTTARPWSMSTAGTSRDQPVVACSHATRIASGWLRAWASGWKGISSLAGRERMAVAGEIVTS